MHVIMDYAWYHEANRTIAISAEKALFVSIRRVYLQELCRSQPRTAAEVYSYPEKLQTRTCRLPVTAYLVIPNVHHPLHSPNLLPCEKLQPSSSRN